MASDRNYDTPQEPQQGFQTTNIQRANDTGTVKLRLDVSTLLDTIENKLRGREFDTNEGRWILPKGARPLINDEQGISIIMKLIDSFVNENTILSDFSNDEIGKMMSLESELIIDHLQANAEKYCNSDVDRLRVVEAIIIPPIFSALKRAKDHGESKAIGDTQTIIERAEMGRSGGGIMPKFFR